MIPASLDPMTIPVRFGQARNVEWPRATPAVRPLEGLHVREAGQGRQASAIRFLALPLLIALGACAPEAGGFDRALAKRGFTHVQLHSVSWLDVPCAWDEVFVKGFIGKRDGRVQSGVLCARDPDVTSVRVFARPTGPAPSWNTLGSVR